MRKLFLNAMPLLGVLGLLFLTGCDEDDEILNGGGPDISIQVNGENETTFEGFVGETFQLNMDVEDDDGIDSVVVRKLIDGVEDDNFQTEIFTAGGQTTFSDSLDIEIVVGDTAENVQIEVAAFDSEGNSSTETIDLSISPIRTYTAVLLYAPLAEESSESFFSASTGETYTVNEVEADEEPDSEDIDFGYYYGVTNAATLASPAAYPAAITDISDWDTRNNTLLRQTEISDSEFQENQNDTQFISDAFDNGTEGTDPGAVNNLQEGDILAFELDNNRGANRGLIRITGIVDGNDDGEFNGEEDYIEIEVVVGVPANTL